MAAAFLRAIALWALLGLQAGAAPAEERVVVLGPRSDRGVAGLALGATAWARDRLAEAGLVSDELPTGGAGLETSRIAALPPAAVLRRLADTTGAARAWTLDLRVRDGEATVRILVVDARAGALLAAGRGEAPLGSLGDALVEATRGLLTQAGLPAPALASPPVTDLDHYGRALADFAAGRLGDAWHELETLQTPTSRTLEERIARLATSETATLGQRARVAVARGDAERARLWIRTQLATTTDPALVIAAAEAAEEGADLARALSLYERAQGLDASAPAAWTGRVRCLARLGRGAEAAALLSAPTPDDVDPADLEDLVDLPALDGAARARLQLRIGELAARRFDAPRADAHLQQAAAADPSLEGRAQALAADLHAALGETDLALAPAERAVALGSVDPEVYETLGRARAQRGDAAGARVAFQRAHELAPHSAGPLEGLAGLAEGAHDPARAAELLHQAIAVAPGDAAPRVRLARLLQLSGDSNGALALVENAPAAQSDPALLRQAAAIRLARGDSAGAVGGLQRAVELEPDDAALRRELASAQDAHGDAAAAAESRRQADRLGSGTVTESAASDPTAGAEPAPARPAPAIEGFDALAASFPTELLGRERAIQVVAVLAPSLDESADGWRRWLHPRLVDTEAVGRALAHALAAHYQVVSPAEIPRELQPADQAVLRAFGGDDPVVARMNDGLGTDAVFVARVTPAPSGAMRVQLRMLVGTDPLSVRRFANETLVGHAPGRWNPSLLVLASLLLVVGSLPILRGWGQLVVGIQYATLGKGFFSIQLARRPRPPGAGREGPDPSREKRFLRRMRLLGRYQRSMVGRETVFRFLPARRYYVAVHGLLTDPGTDDVVGNYFAEMPVVVPRGGSARLDFDFRPKECPLEVCVLDGEQAAGRVLVALRGQADSARYARGGRTLLYVTPGTYHVLVGLEDRVLEREIAISGFAPRSLVVDARDASATLFTGCAGAVEPYVHGNLALAADELERAGENVAAARVRGEYFAAQGDLEQAARCFQQSGRFEDAALLVSDGAEPGAAAALYEQAGRHDKAAEAWRASGDVARAAEQFELAYRYEDALECWREVGHLEKVCELSEKLGRAFDAAESAVDLGDVDRAIRNLQAIEPRDPDHGRACRLLAEIFTERGAFELAVQKLEEAVAAAGGAEAAALDLLQQHAEALERAGRVEEAVAAYETIRARDFHWPDAAERIESLRQTLAAARTVVASRPEPAAPTESRYELIREIGRGGMGVVFQARDRRLGRVVALKRLPENLRNHPTAVRLFLREARAAAALNHRNIVTLFDADQEGDVYFLTMEFLEGWPLHEILARRGRFSSRDVARIGAQAAAGLDYAHGRGVVHRDVKTSNLFFTRDRVVKVMDFGLAKMTEEVRRAATVVAGTPYYMAPEQAAGEDVDFRADLYAFGVTLFELLTGEVPFREGDVAYHHRHTAPPDPRTRAKDVPPDLAELVLWLMAKRAADRPDSTAEVTSRLAVLAKDPGA
jgi:tetratricopeptide (TPR) repeat protein